MRRPVATSLTRIVPLPKLAVPEPLPFGRWATGDYVIAEVLPTGSVPYRLESRSGRPVEVLPGDAVIGALGRRAATLQVVGDWREGSEGAELDMLTPGGVIGTCTSATMPRPPIARLRYLGHLVEAGGKLTMEDAARAAQPPSAPELDAPVVLLIGTSMEAGKTTTGKAVVRCLTDALGLRVAGAKLTGVGRYRDILALGDAGAEPVHDFVDAGLPSTAVEEDDYEAALRRLLALLASARPDVVVAEAGASPLEPYNGAKAIEVLGDRVSCTILCASDPYAVVGVVDAFGIDPDLVAGRATATSAAVDLVGRLTGLPALNALDPDAAEPLAEILRRAVGSPARDESRS